MIFKINFLLFSAQGEELGILASEDAIQIQNTKCTNATIVFSTPGEELRILASEDTNANTKYKMHKYKICFFNTWRGTPHTEK